MKPKPPAATPCAPFERACHELAWDRADDPAWAAHREACPRCRRALEAALWLAERIPESAGPIPAEITESLPREVFARTTRREAPRPRLAWAWAGAGAAAAAAAAAFLALRRPGGVLPEEASYLAEVDLELLENLEVAENLELLEALDALEEMDDG